MRVLQTSANSNALHPPTSLVGNALRGVPSLDGGGNQPRPAVAQSAERHRGRSLRTFFASFGLALALWFLPVALSAQEPSPPEMEVKKLTVRPAGAPQQALRYVLLPELKDKIPGNAIQSYYRAFSPEWWGSISRDKDFYEKVQK